ncbi:MAG TPA: hypothetical protein VJ750_12145 [Rhizomicrobium sp.]|nr:hypothetical protein [Rhizomicrobium sp.]
MSLAIVLGIWTGISILVTPLIGRLMHGTGETSFVAEPPLANPRFSSWSRLRHSESAGVRRNVARQIHRRDANWLRAGKGVPAR